LNFFKTNQIAIKTSLSEIKALLAKIYVACLTSKSKTRDRINLTLRTFLIKMEYLMAVFQSKKISQVFGVNAVLAKLIICDSF